jgi:hypothetical protein
MLLHDNADDLIDIHSPTTATAARAAAPEGTRTVAHTAAKLSPADTDRPR